MAGFTAIAAGVGLATTAATTTASFIQAGKQREAQDAAEAEAARFVKEARAKLDVNYYEGLAIAKEPFELAREQALVQGAMGVEAVREADQRGAAAGVGRIQMAQEQAAAATRADMSQQMQRLEEITAQEEARLEGQKASLDLAEAQGAQLAARDAQEARQQAIQQGMAGVVSLGAQAAEMAPLFTDGLTDSQRKSILEAESYGELDLKKTSRKERKALFRGLDFETQNNWLKHYGIGNPYE